ncbi:NACHT domain-containing protein [Dactylosporangium sp. NPDC050688]|uniref:NACHT domain-containing protein n=1 Tax=Dactylosporangium sp. NPDC050688 TaxID=3157217 RepID=UPI0033E4D460
MASPPRFLGALAKLGMAALPPAVIGASFWTTIKSNPWIAILLFLAYEILVLLWSFGSEVFGELRKRWSPLTVDWVDATLRQKLSRHESRYLRYLKEANFYMDLKGFTTRGPFTSTLDGSFVDLTLLPQPTNMASNAVVDADDLFLGGALEDRNISVWDLLRTSDGRTIPLAIVGPPGSGKTTLLKHVALTLARRENRRAIPAKFRDKIPVLLILRQHAAHIETTPNCTIADITNSSMARSGITEPQGWLLKQLNDGRCVILLDGLDEVATREGRRAVINWVEAQIARYPNNYFVLTSRPYAYTPYPINSATFARVAPFTEGQIEQFINQWYLDTELRAKADDTQGIRDEALTDAADLLRRLRRSAALYRLAINPLLLTMIANVHRYRGALPGSRHELYREICQVFLGKRQEAKQLAVDLTTDQKESVLRRLAFEMMKGRQRDIEITEAARLIKSQLARVSPGAGPEEFLIEIEQTSGLLYEREDGFYSFAHLTFQEYLAAAYIAEHHQSEVLAATVSDDWWRETTLIFVAQYGGDEIVSACLRGDRPSATAIALAIDCAAEARELSPEIRSSLERLLAREAIDDSRRRLIAHVLLIRKLRNSVRVSANTWLCPEPVTQEEFALFIEDYSGTMPASDFTSATQSATVQVGNAAVGMSRETVSVFVNWCRSMVDDARLPTTEELATVLQSNAAIAGMNLAFWTTRHGEISLFKSHLEPVEELQEWLSEQLLLDCTKVADWEENSSDPMVDRLLREIPGQFSTLASVALGVDCRNAPTIRFTSALRDGNDFSLWEVVTAREVSISLGLTHNSSQIFEMEGFAEIEQERLISDTTASLLHGYNNLNDGSRNILANGVDRLRLRELAIDLGGVDPQVAPSAGLCAMVQELVVVVSGLSASPENDRYYVCARVGTACLALSMLYRRAAMESLGLELAVSSAEAKCFLLLIEILVNLALLEWRAQDDLPANEAVILVKSPMTTTNAPVPPQTARNRRIARSSILPANRQ